MVYNNMKEQFDYMGLENINQTDREWIEYKELYSKWSAYDTKPGIWTGRISKSLFVTNDQTGIDPSLAPPLKQRQRLVKTASGKWVEKRPSRSNKYITLAMPKEDVEDYVWHFEKGNAIENWSTMPEDPGTGTPLEIGTLVSWTAIDTIPEAWDKVMPYTKHVFKNRKKIVDAPIW